MRADDALRIRGSVRLQRSRWPAVAGLRLWLIVVVAVSIAASSIATAAEADAARCGRAWRSRGRVAPAGERREPECAGAGWDDGDHVGRVERRSRAGPRADQSRRERQTEEPVRHVCADRGRHHRLGAGHRRAAQGGRRSQYQESGRRNTADGRRAQRQCRSGQAVAGGACRRQRQGRLGRAIGLDVGRRARSGGDGEVPGLAAAPTSTRAASSANGNARSSPSRVPKT